MRGCLGGTRGPDPLPCSGVQLDLRPRDGADGGCWWPLSWRWPWGSQRWDGGAGVGLGGVFIMELLLALPQSSACHEHMRADTRGHTQSHTCSAPDTHMRVHLHGCAHAGCAHLYSTHRHVQAALGMWTCHAHTCRCAVLGACAHTRKCTRGDIHVQAQGSALCLWPCRGPGTCPASPVKTRRGGRGWPDITPSMPSPRPRHHPD